jgi:hypothetical protein
MNMQCWVWLGVPLPLTTRGPPTFNRYYISEEIIAHSPIYQAQLNGKLALIEGDAETIIRDGPVRDPQLVCQTVRFLASGYLTPLNEADKGTKGTWDGLIKLYNFSGTLAIVNLRDAMLKQFCYLIDALNPATFLAFARHYYDNWNPRVSENTSLRSLIKIKLAESLPRLQQTVVVKDISSEGGILGMQLIEVLLEDRALKVPKREPTM